MDYDRGIPTDEKILRTALLRFHGNDEEARKHLHRIHMMEREYARQAEGLEQVQQRVFSVMGNIAKHAR